MGANHCGAKPIFCEGQTTVGRNLFFVGPNACGAIHIFVGPNAVRGDSHFCGAKIVWGKTHFLWGKVNLGRPVGLNYWSPVALGCVRSKGDQLEIVCKPLNPNLVRSFQRKIRI